MIKGFVYIVESPGARDLLDGRTEGRALCEALTLAGIPSVYRLVTTPETFDEALDSGLLAACRSTGAPEGRFPILHLSAHGSQDGIQLTSGHFVDWEELHTRLKPLLQFMENALLLCMSSCHGIEALKMPLQLDPDHHFGWLVGSNDEPLWSDAAVAFITFYHLLFKRQHTIQECVRRMNLASGHEAFTLIEGKPLMESWYQKIASLKLGAM